jgi:hypothetical protein
MPSDAELAEQKKKNRPTVDEHTVFLEDTTRQAKGTKLRFHTHGMEVAPS